MYSKPLVKKEKKKLPDSFIGYRRVSKTSNSYFEPLFRSYQFQEPNSARIGIHTAGNFSEKRVQLTYKPGFHIFKTKKGALRYVCSGVIQKVKIRKKNIINIGQQANYFNKDNSFILVCKEIEVLKN